MSFWMAALMGVTCVVGIGIATTLIVGGAILAEEFIGEWAAYVWFALILFGGLTASFYFVT